MSFVLRAVQSYKTNYVLVFLLPYYHSAINTAPYMSPIAQILMKMCMGFLVTCQRRNLLLVMC